MIKCTYRNFPDSRRDLGIKKAKIMSELIKQSENQDEIDVESLCEAGQINIATLQRWLKQGDFAIQMVRLAPLLSHKSLSKIVELMEKGGSQVQLKAAQEIWNVFSALVARSHEFTMDSQIRKLNVAEDKGLFDKDISNQEVLDILLNDPFIEYKQVSKNTKQKTIQIESEIDGKSDR